LSRDPALLAQSPIGDRLRRQRLGWRPNPGAALRVYF